MGTFENPMLPDGQIDLVLIVNTYHHIGDRKAYFRNLLLDLAPSGRVAVVEPNEELTGMLSFFVKEGHASRAADVEREMRAAGYRRIKKSDGLPFQIFEIYGRSD